MGVASKFSISVSILHKLIQGKLLTLMLTVNGPTELLNTDANPNHYTHCEWTLTLFMTFTQVLLLLI